MKQNNQKIEVKSEKQASKKNDLKIVTGNERVFCNFLSRTNPRKQTGYLIRITRNKLNDPVLHFAEF